MKVNKLLCLVKKDFKLTLRNKTILLLFALPVIFAVLYPILLKDAITEMGDVGYVFLLTMVSVMGIAAISVSSVGTSIAEEKEKKTMRSLSLSNVSAMEFVGSKLIVMLSLFVIDMIFCFFLVSAPVSVLPLYLVLIIFSASALLLVGAIIGVIAENQQSVGVMAMPIMFLSMAPIITMNIDNPITNLFTMYSPGGPLVSILMLHAGFPMMFEYSYLTGFLCLAIWNLIGVAVFVIFFKKKSTDN